jgi:ribosomal protein S18 acetylase RimI-like enzyme
VSAGLRILVADYGQAEHLQAIVELLDHYASDPMGGGEPLSDYARQHLPQELARRPQIFTVLAWHPKQGPIGLVNAVEGFSTFACKPLVNVHDVVVRAEHRGQGVARRMLQQVMDLARARGACKLTLEVLTGNTAALALYRQLGFDNYQLDPAAGQAVFMQKWLDPA